MILSWKLSLDNLHLSGSPSPSTQKAAIQELLNSEHAQHWKITIYSNYPLIRNTIQETAGSRFAKKVSFYKKQNLDLSSILFLMWRSSVICLKAKRKKI